VGAPPSRVAARGRAGQFSSLAINTNGGNWTAAARVVLVG
jgi:hypothetical protein